MIGPHYMLSALMGATTHVVARTSQPVVSDAGLIITPTKTFAELDVDLDILCVPGGSNGTLAAMRDDATLAFVKAKGARARYVTSVCTGSMILGAAGLLNGYRATSHWLAKPLLPVFGATPAPGRVVCDRNRITAEGVTAGIDFGLSLVARLRDRQYAEGLQLIAQYAPQPPFSAGEPEVAPAEVRSMVQSMFQGFSEELRETAGAAFAQARHL
jgi:cyclohexyl-isocyanide hydratase